VAAILEVESEVVLELTKTVSFTSRLESKACNRAGEILG
jgi:hypothetical protein